MKNIPSITLCALIGLWTACSGSGSDDTSTSECNDTLEETGIQIGNIDPSCACLEPKLEPGSNEFPDDWTPISDGDEVVVVHGPQGGWHVWGSVKTQNTRNVVQVEIKIYDIPSGEIVADNGYHVALINEGTCAGSYPGMFAFINIDALIDEEAGLDTPPELICYHPLRIEMTTSDSGGRSITEVVEVIAAPDPADIEDCIIDDNSVVTQ